MEKRSGPHEREMRAMGEVRAAREGDARWAPQPRCFDVAEAPSGKGEERREKQGGSEKCDPGRRGEWVEERKHRWRRREERVKKKGEGVLIGGRIAGKKNGEAAASVEGTRASEEIERRRHRA